MTLKGTPTRSQGVAQESHSSHGEENMDVKARVSRKREGVAFGETEMAGRGGPCSLIASRAFKESKRWWLDPILGGVVTPLESREKVVKLGENLVAWRRFARPA